MSTFDGYVKEFDTIRIDRFSDLPNRPNPTAYFLSHIHTDHLIGLDRKGNKGVLLYCSHTTARLLLRLETYGNRLNLQRRILQRHKRTYEALKDVLRPIPMRTPTRIEVGPNRFIQVTLLDANHCPGAVMFLIQDEHRAILYTGDIRCEKWFIDQLCREPTMISFVSGLRRLDHLYLDTSCASKAGPWINFEAKQDGIAELLGKVAAFPEDTIFYFHAWTWGYEEVMVALASFLDTKIHVDGYKWRAYQSLRETGKSSGGWIDVNESAPLVGFGLGHAYHSGCLTQTDPGVDGKVARIHCCERGMGCEVIKNSKDIVSILPIMTRHKGVEYKEGAIGGDAGDLDDTTKLTPGQLSALGGIIDLCIQSLAKNHPGDLPFFQDWLLARIESLGTTTNLNIDAFGDMADKKCGLEGNLEDLDSKDLMLLMGSIFEMKSAEELAAAHMINKKQITFPYSRHSSYAELRMMVERLRPVALTANVELPDLDMDDLFGDLMNSTHTAEKSNEASSLPSQMPTPPAECQATTPEATSSSKSAPKEIPHAQDEHHEYGKGARAISSTDSARREPDHTSSVLDPITVPGAPSHRSASTSTSKKRRREAARIEGMLRSQHISEAKLAALGANDRHWADIQLVSVRGYHNQEDEVEL